MTKLEQRLEEEINWRAITERVAQSGDVAFSSYGSFVEHMRGGGPAYTDENARFHITNDLDNALSAVAARHGIVVDFGNRGADEAITLRTGKEA